MWPFFFHEWQIIKSQRICQNPTPCVLFTFLCSHMIGQLESLQPYDWSIWNLPPNQLKFLHIVGGECVLSQNRSYLNQDIPFWDSALRRWLSWRKEENCNNTKLKLEFHTFFAGFMKIFVDFCPEFNLWDLRKMCLNSYYDKEHFQRLSFGPLGK